MITWKSERKRSSSTIQTNIVVGFFAWAVVDDDDRGGSLHTTHANIL